MQLCIKTLLTFVLLVLRDGEEHPCGPSQQLVAKVNLQMVDWNMLYSHRLAGHGTLSEFCEALCDQIPVCTGVI